MRRTSAVLSDVVDVDYILTQIVQGRLLRRKRLLVLLLFFATLTSDVGVAKEENPSSQLALRFKSFCLGRRLEPAEMSHRAERLGAVRGRVTSFDQGAGSRLDITFWRDDKSPQHFLFSFTTSVIPSQKIRILGCNVGGNGASVVGVIAALAQRSRLGKPNDNAAQSIIAREAGWFFVKHGEPNWVSVTSSKYNDDRTVMVGLSTHQRAGTTSHP